MLDDFYLNSRIDACWDRTGIDDPKYCIDLDRWYRHPPIEYRFNGRGFRDQDWPNNFIELHDAVWCIGDSFTVGIGQPYQDIWCQQLARLLGRRTINVSMDGSSNAWIARRARDVIAEIQPRTLILHWSFTHRRELPDVSLPDELRRIWYSDNEDDDVDFINHVQDVENHRGQTQVIHSTIPWFSANPIMRELALKKHVKDGYWIAHFDFQDHARDGYHYGPKTALWLARQLADLAA